MKDLSPAEMTQVMEAMVTGRMSDDEIEEFLLGLRQKGETVAEITAAAKVMRQHSLKLSKDFPSLLDTCGTGGDAKNTINVSTLAAIVTASCGASVAKHGNRSVSSACGSADLLELLGVKTDLGPAQVERCLEKTGFGFFFAPLFHPAVKVAMPARKRIQGKTIFNILGPLSNPAKAEYQLIGVYEKRLVSLVADALKSLGSQKALVVHSKDGMDEISISDETEIAEFSKGAVRSYTVKPEDFGLKRAKIVEIQTNSKEESKKMALGILKENKKGAGLELVALNAGAGLYAADKVKSIQDGVFMAQEALQKGKAAAKLDEIIKVSNSA